MFPFLFFRLDFSFILLAKGLAGRLQQPSRVLFVGGGV